MVTRRKSDALGDFQDIKQNLQEIRAHLRKYACTTDLEGAVNVGLTLLLLIVGNCAYPFLSTCWMWCLGVLFCACVNVRVVAVFHDAAHGSTFASRTLNMVAGRFLGGIQLINYSAWYKEHELEHHNKLNREDHVLAVDASSTIFVTSAYWHRCPLWKKIVMSTLRDPIFFFSVLPTFAFLSGIQNPGKIPGLHLAVPHLPPYKVIESGTIDAILPLLLPFLQVAAFCKAFGSGYFWYWAAAKWVGYSFSMMIFHLEHAPAGCRVLFKVPREEYNLDVAGLLGSTTFAVPWWMRWVTMGIEFHHIHHLNRKVPSYKMRQAWDEAPPNMWRYCVFLNHKQTLQSLATVLWDDEYQCFRGLPHYEWLGLMPPLPHKGPAPVFLEADKLPAVSVSLLREE